MPRLPSVNPVLEAHVTAELLRLSVKYDCEPPSFTWEDLGDIPAVMSMGSLGVNKRWGEIFLLDPIRTPHMMSYVLAHEFRHWMTYAKHLPIPLPRGPKWREKRREYSEMVATEFARQETGITDEDYLKWSREL